MDMFYRAMHCKRSSYGLLIYMLFFLGENANENKVLVTATNILKRDYRIQFVCIQVENKFESWIEIHNEAKTEQKPSTSTDQSLK